ncbi:SurA N-terminal domain-containing protein [Halobacillus campisalis]|uniref:SurA N-terminal domain-containing protein n=1 Tax=Halobacillus campisalis TaxID=435909 RepID=A0ABW2K3A1_9BACI|nr:SurA N-terminal domain-containing protein [Halobacillus campisalis]
MKNKWIAIWISIIALIVLAACSSEDDSSEGENNESDPQTEQSSSEENDDSGPVATVNGEELSREDFNTQYNGAKQQYEQMGMDVEGQQEQIEQSVIEEMIGLELLSQEAEAEGHEVSPDEVDERYEEFSSQFESEEAQQEAYEANDLDEETVREELKRSLVINKYVEENTEEVEVTDEEIEEQYEVISEEQGEDAPSLEESRDQIEQQLITSKENEQITKLIDELREEADVEVLI